MLRDMKLAFAAGLLVCIGCSSSSDSSPAGATCPSEQCGGPPPAHCANGETANLTCVREANGSCGWSIDCPQHDAAPDTTGDATTDATSETAGDAPMDGDADQ
jgi:hypothetical protein